MSNINWVCFNCRVARRRAGKCPECGREFVDLGRKIAVPSKSNERAWKLMQIKFRQWRFGLLEAHHKSQVKRKHRLERQIAMLKTKSRGEGTAKLIRSLEIELADL